MTPLSVGGVGVWGVFAGYQVLAWSIVSRDLFFRGPEVWAGSPKLMRAAMDVVSGMFRVSRSRRSL